MNEPDDQRDTRHPDGDRVRPGSLIAVTGASGYIGGRLVGELLDAGYRVRCLVRTPAKLDAAPWRHRVEVVRADVSTDLGRALDGVDAVQYLVHGIGVGTDWARQDAAAARNVAESAARAGVRRIVYLGGLGDDDGTPLSAHLASRHEVGRELASGPVPVTELRAAVVIGSGSASFEMLRYLVEVLPVMVTPRWVETRCQPIAVRDVLRYLTQALDEPAVAGRVLEIGGPEVLTYREMMRRYAEVAGLRRRVVIPVPVLSPSLSARWVGLVTPLPRALAAPLVESLVNEVVVRDPSAEELLPGPLLSYRDAVRLALGRIARHEVPTTWAGAELVGRHLAAPMPTDPDWSGGTVLEDRRAIDVGASPEVVHRTICAIGGEHGWYGSEWLWAVRGVLDKAVGGPGMRRGRRHPRDLGVGEALDFWRVEALEAPHLLRLRAEMALPGDAWLEWRIEPRDGGAHLTQHALFRPRGLLGRAYWLAVAPFHRFVFPQMVRGIADEAEAGGPATESPPATTRGVGRPGV